MDEAEQGIPKTICPVLLWFSKIYNTHSIPTVIDNFLLMSTRNLRTDICGDRCWPSDVAKTKDWESAQSRTCDEPIPDHQALSREWCVFVAYAVPLVACVRHSQRNLRLMCTMHRRASRAVNTTWLRTTLIASFASSARVSRALGSTGASVFTVG